MPRYIAHADTLLSHECRLVKAGDEFDTTFPEGMKLSGNLQLIEPEGKRAKAGGKQEVSDLA